MHFIHRTKLPTISICFVTPGFYGQLLINAHTKLPYIGYLQISHLNTHNEFPSNIARHLLKIEHPKSQMG
ncbi:hypothetical protein DsansV1_C26g0192911 [Dioscorea sansibarensis]